MKRYIILVGLVIVAALLGSNMVSARHENVLRKMILETPLDLWAGKPNRQYTVLGDVKFGGTATETGMYDYIRNVLNQTMKQAILMNADAIINLKCTANKYPHDKGDFFSNQPWIAIAARPMYCSGQAVKYK